MGRGQKQGERTEEAEGVNRKRQEGKEGDRIKMVGKEKKKQGKRK